MADFKLISADSHVNEPPAAWERVQAEYGERAPKVVKDPPGVPRGTWLITEGLAPIGCSHFSIGMAAGKPHGISQFEIARFGDTIKLNETYTYEGYPSGWEPRARLDAQDRDGVAAEILFPSPGRFFYGITDAAFQRAIHHSYNAWLHEFCSANPQRLIGLPLLGVLEVEKTVEDVYTYAKQGFRGAQLPTGIKDGGYYEERFEPLWAAAEETGLVLNVHTTVTQGEQRKHFEGPRLDDPRTQSLGFARTQGFAQQFLGHLIFSGVFDRHPRLKVVCAEFDVGWVPNLYQQVDFHYGRSSMYDADRNLNQRLPSEYLQENVFFTFQDDRAGVLATPVYGEHNFLWASDFPHGVTTWPYSQQVLDTNCEGIAPEVKRKLGRENVARVYGLDLAALEAEAEQAVATA